MPEHWSDKYTEYDCEACGKHGMSYEEVHGAKDDYDKEVLCCPFCGSERLFAEAKGKRKSMKKSKLRKFSRKVNGRNYFFDEVMNIPGLGTDAVWDYEHERYFINFSDMPDDVIIGVNSVAVHSHDTGIAVVPSKDNSSQWSVYVTWDDCDEPSRYSLVKVVYVFSQEELVLSLGDLKIVAVPEYIELGDILLDGVYGVWQGDWYYNILSNICEAGISGYISVDWVDNNFEYYIVLDSPASSHNELEGDAPTFEELVYVAERFIQECGVVEKSLHKSFSKMVKARRYG